MFTTPRSRAHEVDGSRIATPEELAYLALVEGVRDSPPAAPGTCT